MNNPELKIPREKLAIITPTFEEEAPKELFKELAQEYGSNCYVIAVDDGSRQDAVQTTWLRDAGLRGCVIRLEQNLGHQSAIAIGLSYCVDNLDADYIVIMDSDGEDLPSTIEPMLSRLENSNIDVVVASRKSRVETIKFKAFYSIYKIIFTLFVGKSIDFGNFMALRNNSAKQLSANRNIWSHVAGSVLQSNLRTESVATDRGKRYSGNSKMNFVSLTLHGLRSIMVFAETVLVRITISCVIFASALALGLLAMVFFKLSGLAIPGWFSIVSGIMLILLFQTGITALLVLILAGHLRQNSIGKPDYISQIKAVEIVA